LGRPAYEESLAAVIAGNLSRAHGAHALGRATERQARAVAAGNHKSADLYRAVCTIIADRGAVFSRSRAHLMDSGTRASHRG